MMARVLGHRSGWTSRLVQRSWLYQWATAAPLPESPLLERGTSHRLLRSAPYAYRLLAVASVLAAMAGLATGHIVFALLCGVFACSLFFPRLALLGIPALFIWAPRLDVAVSGDESLFLRLDQAAVAGMLAYGVFHPGGSLRSPPGHRAFVLFLGCIMLSALLGLVRGTLTTPVSSLLYLGQWLELYAVYVLTYSIAVRDSGWGFRGVGHSRKSDCAGDRVSGSPRSRGRRLGWLVGGLRRARNAMVNLASRPSREGGNPADSSYTYTVTPHSLPSQSGLFLPPLTNTAFVYAWALPLLVLAAYGLAEARWPYYEEPGVRYRTFERILFPGQANHAAGLFALATASGIAMASTRRFRILGIALALLCSLALVPTGSRSGILAWLTVLGAMALIALPPLRWWGLPMGVVALAAVPASWWQRFAAPGSSMYDRLVAWKSALSTVDIYPLLGLGAGARHRSYYDNHYLMTLAESGMTGMVLLFFLLAVLARALGHAEARLGWWQVGALAGLAALAVHAMATATFIVTMVAGPFFWFCGVAMARREDDHGMSHVACRGGGS